MRAPSNPLPGPAPDSGAGSGWKPRELLAWGLRGAAGWEPPPPAHLEDLLPGYRVEALLGRGAMGAVYRAVHRDLERPVAVKLLPAPLAEEPGFAERFRREAKLLAQLDHPGIVRVHDFGRTAEGHPYFVMEFVDGVDLHRAIHGPGLSPEQALEVACELCEALQYAHRQGVVHRDLKPANVLVTPGGRVKLADFGLARPPDDAAGPLTGHMAIGTPDYMAPEQRRGRGDHRVDLYALGVTMYEMLCGGPPRGEWRPPSRRVTVDARIDGVIAKALQENPDLRYHEANEIQTDLARIRDSPSGRLSPEPARRFGKSLPLAAACLLVAIPAVRLWRTAASGTPPVARVHLHFDEPAGASSAADSSGNGWHGAFVGEPALVPGKIDNAIHLNGIRQAVRLPADVVAACDDFTIAVWVKPAGVPNWSRIFDFGADIDRYMFLTPRNGITGTMRFSITTAGTLAEQQIESPSPLVPGRWAHVAVVLSGATGTLYLDGVPVGENSAMTLRPSDLGHTDRNYIGQSQFPSDPEFEGLVDDFRIFDRALTRAEIASIMEAPGQATARIGARENAASGRAARLFRIAGPKSPSVRVFQAYLSHDSISRPPAIPHHRLDPAR